MAMSISGPPWVVGITGPQVAYVDPATGIFYANGAPVSGAGIFGTAMALLGDSIQASYLNPGVGNTILSLGEHSAITWLERFSMGALSVGAVYAVSGSRLSAHVAQADLVDTRATPLVIENGGVNDIVGDDASVSACLDLKKQLWAKLRAKGATVVSLAVLPVALAGGGSLAKSQKIAAFNQACDLLAAQYGVIRVNDYPLFVNPLDANGYPKADVLYDGLHPSLLGGYTRGKNLWNVIKTLPIIQGYQLAASAVDSYVAGTQANVWIENVLMAGTAGTKNGGSGATAGAVSGNVPDGWDLSAFGTFGAAAITASLVADPDGFGQALQVDITGGAAGDRIEFRRNAIVNGPMALNDIISSEIVCRAVSGTNLTAIFPWNLVQTNPGPVNSFVYGGTQANSPNAYLTGGLPAENVPYLLRTPRVPANSLTGSGTTLTAIRFFVGIYLSGAGSARVLFSRARGRKVVTA